MHPPTLVLLLALAPPPGDSLQSAAVAALTAKCAQCHGPDLPHPKSNFGFVNDPARLIASGTYVVPGRPADSEIWKEISAGDMPPDEAKAGPLTDAEKSAIQSWIASLPPDPGGHRATSPWALLGRTHVAVIHFPIALLLLAAGVELWARLRPYPAAHDVRRVCLLLGALSAVVAAALGWLHASDGFAAAFSDPLALTNIHRWLGTLTALVAPGVAFVSHRQRHLTLPMVGVITLLAALAAATGHFGGLLTHGVHFLDP